MADTPSTPSTPAAPATPANPAAATPSTPATPQHSADRALANFTGTDPAKGGSAPVTPATPATPGTPAAAATDPAPAVNADLASLLDTYIEPAVDPAKPAVVDPAAPVVDPAADPLAALQDNPRVKELQAAEATVKGLLTKSEYVKEAAHIEMAIADADVLWKISEGKADVSVILDAAKQTNPQLFPKLLETLRAYVTKETGVPIAAAAAGQPDPANMTPEQKEIYEIKKKLADRDAADKKATDDAAQAAQVKRVTTAKTTIMGKVTELLKDTVFEGEAERFYELTGPIIGRDKIPQLIDAVEKNDFKLIEMAIKKAQSAESVRLKAVIGRLIEMQKKKGSTIPKQGSSNSPAAPSDPTNAPTLVGKEQRLKNMAESLKTGS